MPMDTDAYMSILQEYDDPVYWEWPPGFDYYAAEQHFQAFARQLEQTLATPCTVESGGLIQDASFRGQVYLPEHLFTEPAPVDDIVVLRVSNWGSLATRSSTLSKW